MRMVKRREREKERLVLGFIEKYSETQSGPEPEINKGLSSIVVQHSYNKGGVRKTQCQTTMNLFLKFKKESPLAELSYAVF